MKSSLHPAARALLLPLLLPLGLWVYSRSGNGFSYVGTQVRSGTAPLLVLPNDRGGTFDLAAHRGGIVLVYFGYTHCPDVCPATLNRLDAVSELLGEDRRRVEQVFVTLDPRRDTPELLRAYLSNFDPVPIGLTIAGGGCRDGPWVGRDLAPSQGRRLYRSHLPRGCGRSRWQGAAALRLLATRQPGSGRARPQPHPA